MLRVLPMFELSRNKSVCFRNRENLRRADLDSWSSQWRIRGRGRGGPGPPVFLDHLRPDGPQNFFLRLAPTPTPTSPLISGSGWPGPSLIWRSGFPVRHTLDRFLCQNVPTMTERFHLDKWNLTIRYSADILVFESSRCRRRRRCQVPDRRGNISTRRERESGGWKQL